MSDRETLERMLRDESPSFEEAYGAAIRGVLASLDMQVDANAHLFETNERLRAINHSRDLTLSRCRKELAELANNRDGLEYDWNERGKEIERLRAALDRATVNPQEENEKLRAEAEEQDGDAAAERARKYAARIDAALALCDSVDSPRGDRLVTIESVRKALKGEA